LNFRQITKKYFFLAVTFIQHNILEGSLKLVCENVCR